LESWISTYIAHLHHHDCSNLHDEINGNKFSPAPQQSWQSDVPYEVLF